MARRETIYTVDAATDTVIRASRDFIKAIEFASTQRGVYVCTSAFGNLKKGQPMVEVEDLLERF